MAEFCAADHAIFRLNGTLVLYVVATDHRGHNSHNLSPHQITCASRMACVVTGHYGRTAPARAKSICVIFKTFLVLPKIALDFPGVDLYNNIRFGVWRSLVSRLVRDQEAAGSSPATPTRKEVSPSGGASFFDLSEDPRPLSAGVPEK